jgi:hypothetical protein
LHEKITAWPVTAETDESVPFVGAVRFKVHLSAAQVKFAPTQVPAVVHVLDVFPASVYPASHENLETSPVVPFTMLAAPLGGRESGAQLFGRQGGGPTLHVLLGWHVAVLAPTRW